MKTKVLRVIAILLLALLILALGTATAGAIAKSNLAKQYPAPGQLVDVGGYKMHINCVGEGSPTVILEAGWAEFSVDWANVQPEVARSTRVCSYDRAGYGWSDPSPLARTANTMVEELHTLLVNANVAGPYVLVGHSSGGMYIRLYAHHYPDEVTGMVLVDSSHEDNYIRFPELSKRGVQETIGQFRPFSFLSSTGLMALVLQTVPNPGLPAEAYAQYQAILATDRFFEPAIAEQKSDEESCAEVRALHITSYGNMPLIVLSRGRWQSDPAYSDAENQQIKEWWQTAQSTLAALSSEGKQIIAEQSGHFIQHDQPDLVIDAIREIVEAMRK